MSPLSEHVRQLLTWLRMRPEYRPSQSDAADTLQAIEQICAGGEPAAVIELVPLWSEEPSIACAAVEACTQLLKNSSVEDYLRIESLFRSRSSWTPNDYWRTADRRMADDKRYIANILRNDDLRATFWGVLSWHGNGYVRERAVRELADLSGGGEIVFLLMRLNDWVAPVRDLATTAVLHRFTSTNWRVLPAHLFLVFRLRQALREDHSQFVGRFVTRLAATGSQELADALNSSIRFTRQESYREVMQLEGAHRETVLRNCIVSFDPVLRYWAARDARRVLTSEALASTVERMLIDKSPLVRREGLYTLVERFPARARDALRASLFDKASSVRDAAQYYLKKFAEDDVVSIYRAAVVSLRKLPLAIDGLGRTGDASDAPLILPHLELGAPNVRNSATRALGKLAGDAHARELLLRIADPSKRVAVAACEALKNRSQYISIEELFHVFRSTTFEHARELSVGLLFEYSLWASLPYLLEAASISAAIAAEIAPRVARQANRLFTAPTVAQRAAIEASLVRFGGSCPRLAAECATMLATRK